MNKTIASLVEEAILFSVNKTGNDTHKHFESNPASNGIIIVNSDNDPIGLVMRTHFYQVIGKKFGFALYMNRPIQLLMKTKILCLDIACEMAQFGLQAMGRDEDDVYDYVIITKNNKYLGVVSISKFLVAMSEMKQKEIEILCTQQKILELANEQERKLREEIEIKNSSIKNLLNNAEQGFLSFDENLIIYEEHSSACNDIFLRKIAGLNFGELMKNFLNFKDHALLVDTLSSVFTQPTIVRSKIYLKLLPLTFEAKNKYIHISYKIISFNKNKVLMVILTDVTDKKALEKKGQEEKENMKLVLSAVNNKAEIIDAIEDARQFFQFGVNDILKKEQSVKVSLSELFRIIHTMKGDFALRSLHNTAYNFHLIEDQLSSMLSDSKNHITCDFLRTLFDAIEFDDLIKIDTTIIREFLGQSFFETENSLSISYDRLELFIKNIENKFQGEYKNFLLKNIEELTNPSLNSILIDYSEYIKILALKLNKKISEFDVTGDIVFINRELYSNFIKSIIHIFRNIVDHAIEPPEDRIEKGKSEHGKILCHILKNDTNFTLEITDDGQGIDPKTIIKIGKEKGFLSNEQIGSLTHSEIINLIFLDSFSTKSEVTTLSGRGVGLAALRNEVEALNGSIEATSKINEGTSFKIILPCTV